MSPTLAGSAPRPAPVRVPASASDGILAVLDEWAAISACPKDLLIDGHFRPAVTGRTLPVEDPSTGRELCRVADADERDVTDALDAAAAAQPRWAAQPARERARVLRRAADALEREVETLAMLVTLEMGKPLAESRDEVMFAARYLEWSAEEAVRVTGGFRDDPDGSSSIMVTRRPVGPCLVITPWNFPVAVPARGIGGALGAGCTVVLRPSKLTPLSALALARILQGAGLPDGVLNVVVSSQDGATDHLLGDPRLRKLTFTGSGGVGRHLVACSAGRMLRLGLELGGQAPFIVFEDADLDAAVEGAVAAKLRNGGAACTAANRFSVHRAVAAEFTDRLCARLAAIHTTRGTEPESELGPMIGAAQRDRLTGLVDDAVAKGARVALAGGPRPGPGWFFAPVVLTDVPDDARVMREEIFGPIAPIRAFDREAEVVAAANDTDQGLAAYVYTRDLDRAMRIGAALDVGMVAVNRGRVSSVAAPFGGVKQSGWGRCGGDDALDDYLETRYVTLARG